MKQITNNDELEFVIFCTESIADKFNVGGEKVYSSFEKKQYNK